MPVTIASLRTIAPSTDPFSSVPLRRSLPIPSPIPALLEARIVGELTDPDVFTRGTNATGPTGLAHAVGGSTFDIAYAASGGGSLEGARVGLPGHAAVNAGDVLTLTPPPQVGERIRYLTVSGTVDDQRRSVPGGEIAFDETRGAETITHVARVISGALNGAGTFSFLARFATAQAADLIQPDVRIRYYAPYRVSVSVTLRDDGDASIRLPIPADAGSRTGYVAVTAADERGNESPISTPAYFAVFKPRPSGAPARPYPCVTGPSADDGYTTPPDRLGRATICLQWDVGDVSPATGLRYEVARALDNSIVATHMRNWHLGKPEADVLAPMAGERVDGDASGIERDNARGVYRATFAPATASGRPPLVPTGPALPKRPLLRDNLRRGGGRKSGAIVAVVECGRPWCGCCPY